MAHAPRGVRRRSYVKGRYGRISSAEWEHSAAILARCQALFYGIVINNWWCWEFLPPSLKMGSECGTGDRKHISLDKVMMTIKNQGARALFAIVADRVGTEIQMSARAAPNLRKRCRAWGRPAGKSFFHPNKIPTQTKKNYATISQTVQQTLTYNPFGRNIFCDINDA